MRTFPVVVGLGCLLALSGCAKRDERRASQPPPAAESGVPAVTEGGGAATGGPTDEVVVDPFCGMRLRKSEAAASAEVGGVTYWFCLADHRDAFLADPQRALCRLAGADAGRDCGSR